VLKGYCGRSTEANPQAQTVVNQSSFIIDQWLLADVEHYMRPDE